jgi:hypothetical protein
LSSFFCCWLGDLAAFGFRRHGVRCRGSVIRSRDLAICGTTDNLR